MLNVGAHAVDRDSLDGHNVVLPKPREIGLEVTPVGGDRVHRESPLDGYVPQICVACLL
jgi:hypothetical protein